MTTLKIDKNDSRLKAVRFLASAMNPEDLRFHVTHFKVESEQGASTDGGRIHVANNIPLEDGFYTIHKNTKAMVLIEKAYDLDTNEGGFPDTAEYIKLPEKEYFGAAVDFNLKNLSSIYTQIIRAMPGKNTLNVNFVRDVCNDFDDVGTFIIPEPRKGEIEDAIHFVSDDLHAAVMPMRT